MFGASRAWRADWSIAVTFLLTGIPTVTSEILVTSTTLSEGLAKDGVIRDFNFLRGSKHLIRARRFFLALLAAQKGSKWWFVIPCAIVLGFQRHS
jgi:hypothetical protein